MPRGPSLAVIDTPPAPPGWEDARADLVRIVDPLGRAVAWLAPAYGGRCVGLAVRPTAERGTAWLQLFDSADPAALFDGSIDAGCSARCALVAPDADKLFELSRNWRFLERDPTAATLEALIDRDAPASVRDLVDGLDLRFTAGFDQGSLRCDLSVQNGGKTEIVLRLGLSVAFAAQPLRDEKGAVDIRLPGQNRGEWGSVVAPRSVAKLGANGSPVAIEVELATGISRLGSDTSPDEETVLLLASAGGEPDGTVTVGAGATYDLSLAIAATPGQRLDVG